MNESVAIGVLWHGGELVIEKRIQEVDDEKVIKYAFPGGTIEEGETPREALSREMNEEVGLDPALLRFGRLRVIRLGGFIGYFGETRLPWGTEMKPGPKAKYQIVLQTLDEIYKEVEDDKMMPLSAEFVERHL
jgi:8-oxo-dGTP pyrophosphatase MutT (NUDIX family)